MSGATLSSGGPALYTVALTTVPSAAHAAMRPPIASTASSR
jgi:hypothetical protein